MKADFRAILDACVGNLECAVSPEEVNEKDRHVVQAALRAGICGSLRHGRGADAG